MALYDGDTIPNLTWEWLDNGNAQGNGTLTINTEGQGVSTKSMVFEYDNATGYETTLDFTSNGFLIGQIRSNKNGASDHTLSLGSFGDLDLLTLRQSNVGINVTNPSEKLDVLGNVKIDGLQTITRSGAGGSTEALKINYDNTNGYDTALIFEASTFDVGQILSRRNGASDYSLVLGDFDNLETLHIRNSNVGVNVSNPTRKLSVDGTVNMSNLPTSSAGLVAGDIWNDGGTLKIV